MIRQILIAAFLVPTAALASAQTPSLAVPAAPVARDVPGAKELPDKTLTYNTIQPEIELDLWALTTITALEMRGWVRVGS